MFDAVEFEQEATAALREQLDGPAVIALSGGVDSTVAAVLAHKAAPTALTAVFVDTGYMRKDESARIRAMLEPLGMQLRIVDAAARFYAQLAGVTDPEVKRKRIGATFIEVFAAVAAEIDAKVLVQGTIAPDWIESGGGLRDTIKSHHNVGGLPADLGRLRLVEPLRDLYKDEVRTLARHLKLPNAERQPFPGPGLAIRVLGEATPKRTATVREAVAIVEEEFEAAAGRKEMELPWQYFAALLPVRTVGVHGDLRAYGEVIVVRAVQSLDGMTAAYSKIPHSVLERISIRITNSLRHDVNRVVFDVTNKPPGTIEWE